MIEGLGGKQDKDRKMVSEKDVPSASGISHRTQTVKTST
jgi:hypothetical protein